MNPDNNPKVMRCAVYTRKSTTAGLDSQFTSLDAQRQACEHFIQSQAHAGWVVAASFDDGGYTGANTDRPGFQSLMQTVTEGRVNVVVVYKVDRLSRSLLDFTKIMDMLNRHNVIFVSVTQHFSTADAIGRLTLNMLMSFAEFEREMISERTRDKIAGARKRGHWTGGTVPFGYQNIGGRLEQNASEAEVVREIFRLYLEQKSALQVTKILNQTQAKARVRGRSTTPSIGLWSKANVLRILQNPIYLGKVPYNGELFEGEHEWMIDQGQFDRVQVLLKGQSVQRERTYNDHYLLAGVLQCACCGAAMTAASTRKKSGETYRYYRCVSKIRNGKEACPSRQLPATEIENFVIEQIQRAAREGELVRAITKAADQIRQHFNEAKRTGEALPAHIDQLSQQLKALTRATPHGSQDLMGTLNDTADQLQQAQRQLSEKQRQLAVFENAQAHLSWIVQALKTFQSCWPSLTASNKHRLVQALIERVSVDEPSAQVTIQFLRLEVPEAQTPNREEEICLN